MNVRVSKCVYKHVFVYVYLHKCVYLYVMSGLVGMRVYVYACVFQYVRMYMLVSVFVCVYSARTRVCVIYVYWYMLCVHVHGSECVYACVCTRMFMWVNVFVSMFMRVCMDTTVQ